MSSTEKAYKVVENYVKRVRFGNTFTTNDLRSRISYSVSEFNPRQLGAIVNKALNKGLFFNVGTVQSDEPTHKGGTVSRYMR